jgi:UDP-2,4-diacetamido-2,4,6-trideoxy-beta-L-altropyranose hydrolase
VKPSIAFRVDSGGKIGTGHVMRCLALAKALREKGVDSLFISRPAELSSESLIEEAGFRHMLLDQGRVDVTTKNNLMHGDFLATSQDEDAQACLSFLRQNSEIEAVIVDHYGIYRPWDEVIAPHVKIFKIDDIADREHLCHGLLDQNFYLSMSTRYNCLVPNHCIKLLGPKYSVVRPQFRDVDIKFRRSIRQPTRVLVSFGGQDPNLYCHTIAHTLLTGTDLSIMIMGARDRLNDSKWASLLANFQGRLQYLDYVTDPLPALKLADFYVGAGGTITWERFASGLPGIVYSIAENQVQMALDLDVAGFQNYAGSMSHFSESALLKLVNSQMAPGRLGLLANKLRSEVDGHGIDRVIQEWNLLS